MEKKFINELSEEERFRIGKIVENMALNYNELCKALFVYDNENDTIDEKIRGDAIDEKLHGSSELMSAFMTWIKGDSFDYIGDSIFQSGGAIPREIFKHIGITDIDKDTSDST